MFNPSLLIAACIIGALSALIAYKRGRNPYLWFFIGFFFGMLGVFALFFSGGKKQEKKIPIFSIRGPKDKFWYYLQGNTEQMGPVSHEAITKAWKEGKIDSSTLIWHEELDSWKPLKELIYQEALTTPGMSP
jgi:hypothetical protein